MPGWELIVVGIIVGGALLWGARFAWRSVRSNGACSDCADSGACPLAENPALMDELTRRGKLGELENCTSGRTNCADLAQSLANDIETATKSRTAESNDSP